MNILWITNNLLAPHLELMGCPSNAKYSGSWLEAAYDYCKNISDINLYILTSANVDDLKYKTIGNTTFFLTPGGGARNYDLSNKVNLNYLKKIHSIIQPDAIISWGSEATLHLAVLREFKQVPAAIYLQGFIHSIFDHYYDGIPHKYRLSTLRDVIDCFNPNSQYNKFKAQKVIEQEIISLAKAGIVENSWGEYALKTINPDIKIFRNYLPIKDEYYNADWNSQSIYDHSIFTNAGGYPIKGHHLLFKALAIVKNIYPDVKCFIPGPKLEIFDNIKSRNGYIKLLIDIINENNLHDNIVYTGTLSTLEMTNYLSKCSLYVMPSVMENHSSSLIEAMMVGTPCISSLVGGTNEIIAHNRNGLLYNSLDTTYLAGAILDLFSNHDKALRLSKEAKKLADSRPKNFGNEMIEICRKMIS